MDIDDTVTIPRVCGTCYFFQPSQVAANQGAPGDNDVIQGPCFYNPPSVHLVQQTNALGHTQSGMTALSPNVASERNACHGWCPDDADPFDGSPLDEPSPIPIITRRDPE